MPTTNAPHPCPACFGAGRLSPTELPGPTCRVEPWDPECEACAGTGVAACVACGVAVGLTRAGDDNVCRACAPECAKLEAESLAIEAAS